MLRILTSVLLVLFLVACEDVFMEEVEENTPRRNFNYLWEQCRDKYAFFEYKNIDWDAVYDRYSPRVTNDIGLDSLFNTLFAMLNELEDGHVNLISFFNVSRFNTDLLGPENIDFRLIRENYLGPDFWITGPFQHDFIAGERVGYVRYESFADQIGEGSLSVVLARYEETDGLILDLRQNGGGSLRNVFRLLNRFAASETLIYNSFIKSGPGPDEFSGPQPAFAEPSAFTQYLGKPVVVLIDRGSFSATSFFALGARALPNMILLGDDTGGGLGIPNGGQLPNGWTYRFSISQTLTPDGENFENGVPPDIRSILQPADVDRGEDTLIERALELIL